MTSYRERRAARADRLREWAGNRVHKATAVLRSHESYRDDNAFNTQPGHIPLRARVVAQDDRAVDSLRKADSMTARADEIERQAANAIYSDDLNATERLTEKIAELEARRETIKAENAAYRKAYKAELAALPSPNSRRCRHTPQSACRHSPPNEQPQSCLNKDHLPQW